MVRRRLLLPIALVSTLVIAGTWWFDDRGTAEIPGAPDPGADVAGAGEPGTTTTSAPPPFAGWSDPAQAGAPYPGASVEGLLTFRGNPTRTYHGEGPVPDEPEVAFRFPGEDPMCSESTNLGETKRWCGIGWTGQPAVFERDGRTWVVFGAYDGAIHFVDADTGERILPDFPTGDLVKGSVTVDPDGYPLVYTGSRDDRFRILSIDGDAPEELWSMHADDVSPTLWNDDWDSSALVIHDHLLVGGENSQFFIVKLNRGTDAAGDVTVAPELVFHTPGWDRQLLAAVGDRNLSIEGSPTVVGDTVYFANSGGLVQGWDLSGLRDGAVPTRTFRYWVGDDVDASIVADAEGMLYVAAEYERAATAARSDAVGQLIKLDPGADPAAGEDPLLWSVSDNDRRPGGMWATPAVVDGVVYAATDGGRLLAVDAENGDELWSKQLPGPLWASPVVVDRMLLIGDCSGVFHAFALRPERTEPAPAWSLPLGGCIEATPAVWRGRVLIGTRGGFLHAVVQRG